MLIITRTMVVAAALSALIALTTNNAQADYGHHHGGGHNHGGGHSHGSGHVDHGFPGNGHGHHGGHLHHGFHGGGVIHNGGHFPTWHDTSHFDYHPPTIVPHGNHFHYQPGHFDLHQTGHWHW